MKFFLNMLMRSRIRYRILPLFNQYFLYNRKEEVLNYCFGFLNFAEHKGDYLEFGVWKGGSLNAAYHLSKKFKNLKSMRFYAFDSFEGLPEIEGTDSELKQFGKGEYNCSLDSVKKALKKNGVDLEKITFTKGWYKDTLNQNTRNNLPIKKASLIYVDCDLYDSTVPVLDFVTPYVSDGTIIVFDDWFCFNGRPDKGEQKAFSEWLEKNPDISVTEYKQFGWMGNSFI